MAAHRPDPVHPTPSHPQSVDDWRNSTKGQSIASTRLRVTVQSYYSHNVFAYSGVRKSCPHGRATGLQVRGGQLLCTPL
jgi:hypothetical protein